VALRLRTSSRRWTGSPTAQRVSVVCHDAVVLLVRYICEQLSEQDVLELTSGESVRNVSITRLETGR
jgi:hypothetical protein